MADVAVERGLRDRPAHRHLAQRVGVFQVGQHGIIHRRASDRHVGIGRKPGQILPVHHGLPRQRRKVDGVALAQIIDRERQIWRRQRAHPACEEFIELHLQGRGSDLEMPLLAIDYQTDPALARNDLLEAEPPGLAEVVRERGRQVDRKGHAVPRQHRIGRRDQVLVAAVEGQTGEPSRQGQRHRAPACLVDPDDIVFPALQRPDRAVEKFRGDFVGAARLKARAAPRAHPLEAQNDAGAAGAPPAQPPETAEPGELQSKAGQKSVVGCQRHVLKLRPIAPRRGRIVLTLC